MNILPIISFMELLGIIAIFLIFFIPWYNAKNTLKDDSVIFPELPKVKLSAGTYSLKNKVSTTSGRKVFLNLSYEKDDTGEDIVTLEDETLILHKTGRVLILAHVNDGSGYASAYNQQDLTIIEG